MLSELNDDCQLMIINYLNLQEQLTLCKATESCAGRLNFNVKYTWQRQKSFHLEWEVLEYFESNPNELDMFLSCVSATIQELELEFITFEQLKRWKTQSYPNMRSLKYWLDDADSESNGVEAVKLIVEHFPNLISLKPQGVFDCKDIRKLKQLRRLDLGECWLLEASANSLFECITLEEVLYCQIDDVDFYRNLLNRLPQLKKLSLHSNLDVLNGVLEARGQDIYEMMFSDSIWNFELETLTKFKSLRNLILFDDDGFTAEQLRSLVSNLPHLEQLQLINTKFWRSESELWQMVKCCPKLKLLNISGMRLSSDFFEFSRRSMENVLNKRSVPLMLHCHGIDECAPLIQSLFHHPKIVISLDPIIVDDIHDYYIQVKFTPVM